MIPRYVLLLPFLYLSQLLLLNSAHQSYQNPNCPMFECGNHGEVGFPFSKTYSSECGPFALNCTTPEPTVQFHKQGKWYQVDLLNYLAQNIIICDQEVKDHLKSNQCGLLNNFTETVSPFISVSTTGTRSVFKCKREPTSLSPSKFFQEFRNYTGCKDYDLFFYEDERHLPPLPETLSYRCSVVNLATIESQASDLVKDNETFLWGANFNIKWNITPACLDCYAKGVECQHNPDGTFKCGASKRPIRNNVRRKVALALAGAVGSVAITFLFCLVKKYSANNAQRRYNFGKEIVFWKRKNKAQRLVEDFLKTHGSIAPRRYNFSEIKKITSSFKEKIGQGGYGGVYKGKLVDGRLVAVKLLNKEKGNGEEFINEVASISRTSHVNVVSLLGFCFDGSKRALIYEFMVNGSLEKFIYDQTPLPLQSLLTWETHYKIVIGVARGLEYLHRGCNTRILHFDIKPHNILLDQDFTPKISDFGLAKLCLRDESIISMVDARGTAGYIAPEVFNRKFGGVSHKSDVFSYGMMVLEIVGRRKNINVQVDHTSEIYFPNWIYGRLELDKDLGLHGITSSEETDITRKMILVALWCIQTNPTDRPTMSRVVEMLERRNELLSIPPRPYLCSSPRSPVASSHG